MSNIQDAVKNYQDNINSNNRFHNRDIPNAEKIGIIDDAIMKVSKDFNISPANLRDALSS